MMQTSKLNVKVAYLLFNPLLRQLNNTHHIGRAGGTAMLVVNNIEVVYNGVIRAVQNVSLEVPAKSVVTLLGANGAGKTSVLRAISGLLGMQRGKLVAGTITLEGQRIDNLEPSQIVRRGLAQVLEGRRIFGSMTVEENLQAGAYSRRDSTAQKRTYDQVLHLFPVLAARRKQAAGYLSGGEQQMLAIGRALMAGPRILLLDEPSLGLAPFIVQQIREVIAEINAEGTAVLLVEQNAAMALAVAQHGYIMETGRIVHDQVASEMLADDQIKRFYLGLNEAGTRRDYSRFKDKEVRQAEREARKAAAL
jgi:branched-chain amino acid transport system ATP-binding protein